MPRYVDAADMFAGAGGTSTGLAMACKELGRPVRLTAINDWPLAIQSHTANHPWATHINQRVQSLDPRVVIPGGRLDILVASPECTYFSTARGGRPVTDQLRASAWDILRWLELLRVESVLVENVPEFRFWGSVGRNGRPIKKERGKIFDAWTRAIRSLGYNVGFAILNAADYGDATSRKRLFVMARRGSHPIVWPQAMYSRDGQVPGTKRWRAAREVIDFTIPSESIYKRKRPLAPNTMARIREGIRRFGGDELQPFLILMEHGGGTRSVDSPLPTITTAKGGSMGVAEPFVVTTDRPVTNRSLPRSIDEPTPTVVSQERIALVEPFIIPFFGERNGQDPRSHSVDEPMPAPTSHGAGGLVEPYLVRTNFHPASGRMGAVPSSTQEPIPTILGSSEGIGLVEPFLTRYYGQDGVVKPSAVTSVEEAMPTVTTKDRFGLVQSVINGRCLDIRFRMLQPKELAGAMGFPPGYVFSGSRSQIVRQVGNAVAVNMARALCKSLLSPRKVTTL